MFGGAVRQMRTSLSFLQCAGSCRSLQKRNVGTDFSKTDVRLNCRGDGAINVDTADKTDLCEIFCDWFFRPLSATRCDSTVLFLASRKQLFFRQKRGATSVVTTEALYCSCEGAGDTARSPAIGFDGKWELRSIAPGRCTGSKYPAHARSILFTN